MKFGVGHVLGECEPGQVKLKGEEMLPRMGETVLNPVNDEFKGQGNAAWKLHFLPAIFSHFLEAYG